MSQQAKQHAWYAGVAAVIASLLGALIEQNVIPPPWNGVAVAVGMLLGSLVSPPSTARQQSAEELLAKLERMERRRKDTPQSMPPVRPSAPPEDP